MLLLALVGKVPNISSGWGHVLKPKDRMSFPDISNIFFAQSHINGMTLFSVTYPQFHIWPQSSKPSRSICGSLIWFLSWSLSFSESFSWIKMTSNLKLKTLSVNKRYVMQMLQMNYLHLSSSFSSLCPWIL